MTAPNGKHEFEAAKIFFEERLKDYLKQDKSLAVQDKPDGLVHPIYMGRRVETYYRAAIAALKDYEKAEAEASDAQVVMKAMMIEIDNLKAELARWEPVIEAVEKARKSTLTDDRVFWGVDEDAILQAALAYKERSQPNE